MLTPCHLYNTFVLILLELLRTQVGSHIIPFAASATAERDRFLQVLCQAASFVHGQLLYLCLLFLTMKLRLLVFYLLAVHSGVVDVDDDLRLLPMQWQLQLGSSR